MWVPKNTMGDLWKNSILLTTEPSFQFPELICLNTYWTPSTKPCMLCTFLLIFSGLRRKTHWGPEKLNKWSEFIHLEARDVTRSLRTLLLLKRDQVYFPASTGQLEFQGIQHPLLAFMGQPYMWYTSIHVDQTSLQLKWKQVSKSLKTFMQTQQNRRECPASTITEPGSEPSFSIL